MGNKDHLPKFPGCADEAPAGKISTEYDEKHFSMYSHLLIWLAEGATQEELCEHMFDIDARAELHRARKMVAGHLEHAKWVHSPECFPQLISPQLRKRPAKKGGSRSSGGTIRRVTTPKHRKKPTSYTRQCRKDCAAEFPRALDIQRTR